MLLTCTMMKEIHLLQIMGPHTELHSQMGTVTKSWSLFFIEVPDTNSWMT